MGSTGNIPLQSVIPGQLISSALWNNEFTNIDTLMTPSGIDTYSSTDSEMQIQTNPYPGSVTSHATSLGGELERIRYQLAQILGTDYWYKAAATNLDTVSDVVVPLGSIIDYPSITPPNSNWHLADGTAISRTIYADLFALIGTNFGAGDGSLTFNIPDARDRFTIGAGSTYSVAGTGGSDTVNLSHTHLVLAHYHVIELDGSHDHSISNHTHTIQGNGATASYGNTNPTKVVIASGGGLVVAGTGSGGTTSGDVLSLTTTASGAGNTSTVPTHDHRGRTDYSDDTASSSSLTGSTSILNPYLAMAKMIRIL